MCIKNSSFSFIWKKKSHLSELIKIISNTIHFKNTLFKNKNNYKILKAQRTL